MFVDSFELLMTSDLLSPRKNLLRLLIVLVITVIERFRVVLLVTFVHEYWLL